MGSTALIDTPSKFAEWAGLETPEDFNRRDNNASEKALRESVLHAHLLCGDPNVFKEFQAEQRKIYSAPIPDQTQEQKHLTSIGEVKALEYMKGNSESVSLSSSHSTASFDLKQKITRPIQRTVIGLCMFYGIEETNTLKALDILVGKGRMNRDLAVKLKELYKLAYRIRANAHIHYKKEIDKVSIEGKIDSFITDSDLEDLRASQALIVDVQTKQDLFLKSNGQKNPFV
jgi:signal-transduction protein with cAMP-binding, CBS, and nucleotidyltransferase domain